MKAIATTPKQAFSARLIELPEPAVKDDEVLVQVLEAGICTTDREIYEGLYGEAPEGENSLIMGHESLGIVKKAGANVSMLKEGDYVVRTVRRPCNECINCENNEQDMCLTGNFKETGIKGLHGVMVECYTDWPENLVKLPKRHRDVGVLLEPLSFALKTIRQAYSSQRRLRWNPKKALIFGAGPVGLLAAFILRNKGVETHVMAKSERGNLKSRIVESIGGVYFSLGEIEKLDSYDIIIECSGDSSNILRGLKHLGNNSILCLTSITGSQKTENYPVDSLNLDIVLGNKMILGVVNSNMRDYRDGIKLFSAFKKKWPGALPRIISRKTFLNSELNISSLFRKEKDDIKVVLDLRGADGKA